MRKARRTYKEPYVTMSSEPVEGVSRRMLLAIVLILALIAGYLFLKAEAAWWTVGTTFGPYVGEFRVNDEPPSLIPRLWEMSANGTVGFLNNQPVIVHVGDTLDVHLDNSHGTILSSNHEVLGQADQLFGFLSDSVRFRVLSVGTAQLTTSTRDGCSTFEPPMSASCGVLNVTVFR
jgi:hypothetical protein